MKKTKLFFIVFVIFLSVTLMGTKKVLAIEQPSLSIIAPSLGDKWIMGNTYTIKWEQNNVDTIGLNLNYSNNSSVLIIPGNANLDVNINQKNQSYTWTVPTNLSPADDVRIKILGWHTGYGQTSVLSEPFRLVDNSKILPDLTIVEAHLYKYIEGTGPGTGYIYGDKPKIGDQAFMAILINNIGTKNFLTGGKKHKYNFSGTMGSGSDFFKIGNINPKGFGTFVHRVGKLVEGKHVVNIFLDPDNEIKELDKTNNNYSFSFTVDGIDDIDNSDDNKQQIDSKFINRLKGKLLLQVQDKGRIWYVNPDNARRYEVTFANALNLFKKLSLGITNTDLYKIPMNINSVSDKIDTDNDGYSDKSEVLAGYNPEIASNSNGNDKINVDINLSKRLKGKLLLQVEDRGRIWYVDFEGKRWEVTWKNLMDLFKRLSLGITNDDLNKIDVNN